MHENVRSLIIPFVLILNILLSSQWTICSEGYSGGTMRVQYGTLGVQWGYSGDTVGVQWGYRVVQEKSIKRHNTGILFFIFIVTSCTQYNKRTWYDMLYMRYFL